MNRCISISANYNSFTNLIDENDSLLVFLNKFKLCHLIYRLFFFLNYIITIVTIYLFFNISLRNLKQQKRKIIFFLNEQ